MVNQISCCVKNCTFNDNKHNICTAPTVSISNCISSNSQTTCSTFIPKNK